MDPATIQMLLQGIVDTLYMTAVATLLAYIIGLPLGVIQVVTAKDLSLIHIFSPLAPPVNSREFKSTRIISPKPRVRMAI